MKPSLWRASARGACRLAVCWSRVDRPPRVLPAVMHNIVIDQARARKRRPRELFAGHDRSDPRAGDQVTAVELSPPCR